MDRRKKIVLLVYIVVGFFAAFFWFLAYYVFEEKVHLSENLAHLATELAGIFMLFVIVDNWFLKDEIKTNDRIENLLNHNETQNRFSSLLISLNDIKFKEQLEELLILLNSLRKEKLPIEYGIFKEKLLYEFSILARHNSNSYILPFQMTVRDIQHVYSGYINLLRKGNTYKTVTNLEFWKSNLDNYSTLLHDNIEAAKRKVIIHRIFVVNASFNKLDDIGKKIIKQHQEATADNNGITTKVIIESGNKIPMEKFSICESTKNKKTMILKMEGIESVNNEIKYTSINISTSLEDIQSCNLKFSDFIKNQNLKSINDYVNQKNAENEDGVIK